MKIGVLDIQGSVEEHFAALKKLGADFKGNSEVKIEPILVKKSEDLKGVKGLIIPGGESTTIGKLLKRFGLKEEIVKRVKAEKLAVWGTCAGAILIAKKIGGEVKGRGGAVNELGLMDITIERNAYGRQIDSFETEILFDFGDEAKDKNRGLQKIPAVFIRAPLIKKTGKGVKILAKNGKEIAAVREGNLLATTFHPEMTDDLRVHRYFMRMCR